MDKLIVNNLPLWGKFAVLDIMTKKILFEYDGEGKSDFPQSITNKEIIALYASDDKIIIEVFDK